MSAASYFDVFEIKHEPGSEDILAGDLVRMGANLFPHYKVLAIHGETAWVRDVQTGRDGLAPLMRCQKINGPIDT